MAILLNKKFWWALILAMALMPALASAATIGRPANNLGLVGYWPLDGATTNWSTGKTADVSGNDNTGQFVNVATTTSPVKGKMGQALNFRVGDAGYINVGDTPSLSLTGAVSVSAWIKATTTVVNAGFAGKYDSATGNRGYLLAHENVAASKKAVFYYQRTTGVFTAEDAVVTATDVLDGTWVHLVGTFQPSVAGKIYVNGVLSNTDTTDIQSAIADNDANFRIATFSTTQNMDGTIDDVRVYNRVLSAEEVAALYNSGTAVVGRSASGVDSPLSRGLVGYWTLDGGATNWSTGKTSDLSNNGNTGQLISMSTSSTPSKGQIGQAMQFDGSNDFVRIGTTNWSATAGTYSFWARPNGDQVNLAGQIFCHHDAVAATACGNGNRIYGRYDSTNELFIGLGASPNIDTNLSFPLNAWTHWTVSYNAGNYVVYKNGVVGATGTYTNTLTIQANAYIGADGVDASTLFNGTIDDVRIYNRVLSPNEVKQLYTMGAAVVGQSSGGSGSPFSSGLVGYWSFDGGATNWTTSKVSDLSGQGNTGQLILMSTTSSPTKGKIGQAFSFDGADDYMQVTDAAHNYAFGDSTFTVSVWCKPSTATTGFVVAKDGGGLGNGWAISCQNTATFHTKGGGGTIAAARTSNSTTLNNGGWHHIVAVITTDTAIQTNNTGTLYVDGVVDQGSLTNSTVYVSPTLPVTIGKRDSGNFFAGSIDELRIYNRALSPTEVKQLYDAGR
jgi:hypothetical protein